MQRPRSFERIRKSCCASLTRCRNVKPTLEPRVSPYDFRHGRTTQLANRTKLLLDPRERDLVLVPPRLERCDDLLPVVRDIAPENRVKI